MIESVYGESSQVLIPKGLQILEGRADGEDKANASLGRLNSLNLHEGYRATMIHWQDDLSAPTRLGEPTITVRLARLNGAQLVPWNAENTGHDWELSQLTIRKSQIAKEANNLNELVVVAKQTMPDEGRYCKEANNLKELVAVAKQTMPDEGRYCVVIPMQQTREKWTGQALDSCDRIVTVTYDDHIGLQTNRGKDE